MSENENNNTDKKQVKPATITHYEDGESIKAHNKRITFVENDSGIILEFSVVENDPEKVHIPAVKHTVLKNKVRVSNIKLNRDAMDKLCYAWIEYNKRKITAEKNESKEV